MLRRVVLLCLATLATSAAATLCHAAPTLGLEGFAALNTYSLSDVQSALDQANADGENFEALSTSGVTGGGGLRVWATPNWMFSAVYEPLRGESTNAATLGEKLNVDANSFQLTGAYFWPGMNRWKFGLGAGVGVYSLQGEVITEGAGPSELQGTNVGFHGLGLAEWSLNPSVGITAGAGFRHAEVAISGSSNESTVDYSGFLGRVGIAFYMPTSR